MGNSLTKFSFHKKLLTCARQCWNFFGTIFWRGKMNDSSENTYTHLWRRELRAGTFFSRKKDKHICRHANIVAEKTRLFDLSFFHRLATHIPTSGAAQLKLQQKNARTLLFSATRGRMHCTQHSSTYICHRFHRTVRVRSAHSSHFSILWATWQPEK